MLDIILGSLFCLVCILLMLIILLQRGRGTGLSGAFGGMGGHSAFGAKTGDVFTWVTVGFTAVYLLLAVLLNYVFVPVTYTLPGAEQPPATVQPQLPEETPPPGEPVEEAE